MENSHNGNQARLWLCAMTGPGGVMGRTFVAHMPRAEARYLAGAAPVWPAAPEARWCLTAIREWLADLPRRRTTVIPVHKVIADLTAILDTVPLAQQPLHGPFGPGRDGPPLPGRVDYLGGGIVRLDQDALSYLAALSPAEDYHVTYTDAGPVLTIGADQYLAREEEPDTKP